MSDDKFENIDAEVMDLSELMKKVKRIIVVHDFKKMILLKEIFTEKGDLIALIPEMEEGIYWKKGEGQ